MDKFALSESTFDTIKDAENKVTAWWRSGSLKNNKVKLYKVVEVYDLKFKFVKRRKK